MFLDELNLSRLTVAIFGGATMPRHVGHQVQMPEAQLDASPSYRRLHAANRDVRKEEAPGGAAS